MRACAYGVSQGLGQCGEEPAAHQQAVLFAAAAAAVAFTAAAAGGHCCCPCCVCCCYRRLAVNGNREGSGEGRGLADCEQPANAPPSANFDNCGACRSVAD